ncbi:MAG: hypothetical protein ABUS48_03925 [Pseudomonadota bacterium]
MFATKQKPVAQAAGFLFAWRRFIRGLMGLRLLAHYYDLNEALIVKSALDSAGVCAFLHGYPVSAIAISPWDRIAMGGFRIMVVQEELMVALAAMREARLSQSFEGERLAVNHHTILSLIASYFFLGIPLPLTTRKWIDVSRQDRSAP